MLSRVRTHPPVHYHKREGISDPCSSHDAAQFQGELQSVWDLMAKQSGMHHVVQRTNFFFLLIFKTYSYAMIGQSETANTAAVHRYVLTFYNPTILCQII